MESNDVTTVPLPDTLRLPGEPSTHYLSASSDTASTASTVLPSYESPAGTDMSATRSKRSSIYGSHTTTSSTREQLRQAEAQLESMRLEVEKQKDTTEQLKREARLSSKPLPMRSQLSLSQLKYDLHMAGLETKREPIKNLFKDACATDLLFLVDTTGSMGRYITAAKNQILDIVQKIKSNFANEASVRIAVVGYKDHGMSSLHFSFSIT